MKHRTWLFFLATSGCFYIKPVWQPAPLEWGCEQQCFGNITIPMDDLESCFLDPSSGELVFPSFSVGNLADIEPVQCNTQRNSGANECNLNVPGVAEVINCCALESDILDGSADCCPEQGVENSTADDLYVGWQLFFQTHCPSADLALGEGCIDEEEEVLSDECFGVSASGYVDATITIDLDPVQSWISVSGPAIGSVSSSVSGFGGARTSPNGFVTAYAVGDPVINTASGKFTNLELFLLEDSFVYSSNGNFYLPPWQLGGVHVQGLLKGKAVAYGVSGTGAWASGQMRPDLGYWFLNYSSNDGGYTVNVHLEGDAQFLN